MSRSELPYSLAVLEEDQISPTMDRAIRDLLCECFPADSDVFPHTRYWNDLAPEYTVVCESGQQVVGHLAITVRTITSAGKPIRVAGPLSVAVAVGQRGAGLSRRLMDEAFAEAVRRRVPFGLLFCVPELEPLYSSMGWQHTDQPVTMRDEQGRSVPLPRKNNAMFIELGNDSFPRGPLDLRGRDW